MNSLIPAFAAGLATSLALIIPLSKLAVRIGLVDTPTERKRHVGRVPLVGGAAVVAAMLVWLPLFELPTETALALLALVIPALLLGIIDDRMDLSARLRFGLQMLLGIALVYAFEIRIVELDGIVSSEPLLLPALTSAVFTVLCVTGVLNATNMTDGVDGLLGTVACLSLCVVAGLAHAAGHVSEPAVAMLVAGSLVGYLLFNLGLFGINRKIFLGDSGSLAVGLVLVVLMIALSQGENPAFSPTAAGWLLGLPLLDTVTVMVRRMALGQSPFSAGRDHFHHQLLDAGFSPRQTLSALATVHAAMLAVGVSVDISPLPELVFFWAFVALTLTHFFLTPRVARRALRRIAERGASAATGGAN